MLLLTLGALLAGCDSDSSGNKNNNTPRAGMGDLPFMSACSVEDDQCDGAQTPPQFCFTYNMKGSLCTHECESAADCAAPSTGCSGMGVCKAP